MSDTPLEQTINHSFSSEKHKKSSLHILGYLFLRMNLWDKAERTFKAILAISDKDQNYYTAQIALAAVCLEKHEYKQALEYLNSALEYIPISSKNASIHLMRAKALWFEERHDEAKNAIDEYTYLISSKG